MTSYLSWFREWQRWNEILASPAGIFRGAREIRAPQKMPAGEANEIPSADHFTQVEVEVSQDVSSCITFCLTFVRINNTADHCNASSTTRFTRFDMTLEHNKPVCLKSRQSEQIHGFMKTKGGIADQVILFNWFHAYYYQLKI